MVKCPVCRFRKTQTVILRDDKGFVVETFIECKLCKHIWKRKKLR